MRAELQAFRRSFLRWPAAAAFAAALALSCTAGTNEPADGIVAPSELSAEAVGLSTVRLSWRPSDNADIAAYQIERRADLQGEFKTIKDNVAPDPGARVTYFDTDVEPNRYYGYRVRAVTRLGSVSAVSNIAGAKTAPVPGLRIVTSTTIATAESADPDGYIAVVRGPRDTSSVSLGANAERLISPVVRGAYSVVLRGLSVNCATRNSADTVQSTSVTDEGTRTISSINFSVSCRDPRKASIVAVLQTAGDTVDADGIRVIVSGIIREAGTPPDERVYVNTQTITGTTGNVRFDNLRPGDYEVSIADIDSPCVANGETRRTIQPRALAVDTLRFGITCRKPVVIDTVGRPIVLRQAWSNTAARPGDRISLLTSLDVRARPAQQIQGVSGLVQFDNTVVRFDSARTLGSFEVLVLNRPQPNILAFAGTNVGGQGLTGDIQIVRHWFTVVGAVGSSVRPSTTVSEVLDPAAVLITSQVRVENTTLNITAGGGGPVNQPPTAVISGPSTGVAGTALSFSGSQSTDSDGTIVSYAWSFGGNSTGTGASVSHTFTAAGNYTVRLTVTDNSGATSSRDLAVTISPASATTGTISGTVTSPQRGALSGVTVTGGGLTATSATDGTYTIANVPSGAQSVTISGIPAGCTAPAAQSVTVAAGGAVTANFTVTCPATGTSGTVTGRVTRASDASGIANARVIVQPAGGTALSAVTTAADGSYSVSNVPLGSGANAGNGAVTVIDLPAGCTAPAAQSYTGLTAGGTVTRNVSVTCQVATTGALTGTITRSTGGNLSGVSITVTPAGAAALPAVTTNASGVYTVSSVPPGNGSFTIGSLPTGCTNPGAQNYTGVVAGGSVTRNVTITCTAAAHTYSFSGAWGPITNTGSTGRQVTLILSIDMGGAPGRTDINGNNADELAGITFDIANNIQQITYQSRLGLTPNGEFDLNIVNQVPPAPSSSLATTTGALASSGGQTITGNKQLLRITFNIVSGFTGSVAPALTVREALATINLVNVTSSVVVVPIPALTVP